MDKVLLAGTDLLVSRVCLGNMTFGSQTAEAEARRMVDSCLDHGINFFDTANVYNKGASEEMLGRILEGRRGRVVVASKVRGVMGPAPDESGLSRPAMLKAIDGSLRRLQTDYLDLYYLHQPDYAVPFEETLETMEQITRSGKVRFPAISNYAAWQVCQSRSIADAKGYRPIHVTQIMYNLLARGIEQEFIPFATEFRVPLVVYNPLAGGLLTGKQKRESPIEGTRFDGNRMYLDRYWHPTFFDAVDELAAVARDAGRSLVSLAFNWLLHHTQTACVIAGASRLEQLEQNLEACREGPLTEDAVQKCDNVWSKLRGVTPKYNR